ncbi:MAG: aspartate--tRNA ligase [Spirochaetales bacterium]|nr:aspartate--tRNA ligase [Spirochaetales bacterium]
MSWLASIYKERLPVLQIGKATGKKVRLCGWAFRHRDQGGLIFIDLRDRSGIGQLVFDRSVLGEHFQAAETIRSEFVLAVEGQVRSRARESINPRMATGEVEVLVERFEILNASRTLPFELEFAEVGEEHRLRYRYLDLRREAGMEALAKRSHLSAALRRFLEKEGFLEVETPVLNKSTPEGARDFLVPARLSPGSFYALPQSPQIFKQILMVAGVEKYFQIARCFRDEDLRADRQPEFTQLDMELSFIDEERIMALLEKMWARVLKEVFDLKIKTPILRMTHAEAMESYGIDRPDLRFEMKLVDVAPLVKNSQFQVFRQTFDGGGRIKALCVPGGASLSRKDIDDLTAWVNRDFKAKGLAWLKHEVDGLKSSISKFFSESELRAIERATASRPGDIVFFAADRESVVNATLAHLRLAMGEKFGLIPPDDFRMVWITDFPLFEKDPDSGAWHAVHHPFTAPAPEDLPILLDADRFEREGQHVRSRAYDLVVNGTEIGGGSIRIHDATTQSAIFRILKISPEEASERFGFLLDALSYGAPPHGGVAFGLDRILMLFLKRDSIRDVIPFPKTQKGHCLMSESPSPVSPEQLKELRLRTMP